MTPTRAEQAEKTRQAVLDTARRLFVENGYDATSLQQIADTMGVTKANVYYYFHTKAEILEAIIQVSAGRLAALFEEAAAIEGKRARQEFVVEGFVGLVVGNRALSPMNQTDPGLRRHGKIKGSLDAMTVRALYVLFGDRPSVDERAAYHLVSDLGPVMRALPELTDDELRDTLKRLCLRLLPAE